MKSENNDGALAQHLDIHNFKSDETCEHRQLRAWAVAVKRPPLVSLAAPRDILVREDSRRVTGARRKTRSSCVLSI